MHYPYKLIFAFITSFAFLYFAPTSYAFAERFDCSSKPYKLGYSASHQHKLFAPHYPGEGLEKEFKSFYSVFDSADDDNGDGVSDLTAQPTYVSYHLKGVQPDESGQYREPKVSIDRPRPWYRSNLLAYLWGKEKGLDASYRGIGTVWNRGHWMPADHAQRISAEASCNTHTFHNASPHQASLNQGAWRLIENFASALSNEYTEAWVVTGPIFDQDAIQYIGDADETLVAVPDALFHITFVKAGQNVLAYPFIVPQTHTATNPPQPDKEYKKCRTYSYNERQSFLRDHVTNLAEIENRTGLNFLTEFPENIRAPFLSFLPSIPKPQLRFYDPAIRCFKEDDSR